MSLRKTRCSLFRSRREARHPETIAADDAVAIQDRLEVGRLMGLLTERQRTIVVAHYYLGLTHEEIAGALGVRRGTVSATVSQSLARMREGGTVRG